MWLVSPYLSTLLLCTYARLEAETHLLTLYVQLKRCCENPMLKLHLQPSPGCLLTRTKSGEHHQWNLTLQLHLKRWMWLILPMEEGESWLCLSSYITGALIFYLHLLLATATSVERELWPCSQTNTYPISHPYQEGQLLSVPISSLFERVSVIYHSEHQLWQSPFLNPTPILNVRDLQLLIHSGLSVQESDGWWRDWQCNG